MWFFETMAQFYNWISVMIGFEDPDVRLLSLLGISMVFPMSFIIIVGIIKKAHLPGALFISMFLAFGFGMMPIFVMHDRLQECKKVVITHLDGYDSTVFVLNCRYKTDMNGEFGEWNLQKIPQLETPKRK